MSLSAKSKLAIGFACSSGWSEVICFSRYHSFAALMTGNTVQLGIAATKLIAPDPEVRTQSAANVAYYLCVLASYMLGATVLHFIKQWKPNRAGTLAAPLCLFLVVACETVNCFWPENRWQVCILAPMFGIQNSLTFFGPLAANTTMITGNMQRLSLAFWQFLARKMNEENLIAIALPGAAIIATLLSAIAGAFVMEYWADGNNHGLFVPSGVLQAFLLVKHDKVLGVAPTPAAAQVDPKAEACLAGSCPEHDKLGPHSFETA